MSLTRHQEDSSGHASRGFTLLELLIVVVIVGALLAIVGTSLAKARAAAKNVMCMNNLKTVAHEFIQFADDHTHPDRGDSERYGARVFRLEDFQEKIYRIDEFWDGGGAAESDYDLSEQPLMCPAGPGTLQRQRWLPCSQLAVTPARNVSIGFNMRLDQISTVVNGWPRLQRTLLTSRIRSHPHVPLAFDVDGVSADASGVLPYYSAPPADDLGLYGSGRF